MGVSNNIGENYHLCNGEVILNENQEIISIVRDNGGLEKFGGVYISINTDTLPIDTIRVLNSTGKVFHINELFIFPASCVNSSNQYTYGYLVCDESFKNAKFYKIENSFIYDIAYDEDRKMYIFACKTYTGTNTNNTFCSIYFSYDIYSSPTQSNIYEDIDFLVDSLSMAYHDNQCFMVVQCRSNQDIAYKGFYSTNISGKGPIGQYGIGILSPYYVSNPVYFNGHYCYIRRDEWNTRLQLYYSSDQTSSTSWSVRNFNNIAANVDELRIDPFDEKLKFMYMSANTSSNKQVTVYGGTTVTSWSSEVFTLPTFNGGYTIHHNADDYVWSITIRETRTNSNMHAIYNTGNGIQQSDFSIVVQDQLPDNNIFDNDGFTEILTSVNGQLISNFAQSNFINTVSVGIGVYGYQYPKINIANTVNTFIRCK